MADHGLAPGRCSDPQPARPWRLMAHVLEVAAGEFSDPVAGLVPVPETAVAVAMNVTVTQPSSAGLRVSSYICQATATETICTEKDVRKRERK